MAGIIYPRYSFHTPSEFFPCRLCQHAGNPSCPECKGSGKICTKCLNNGSACECNFAFHYASALEAETFNRQKYAFLTASPPNIPAAVQSKIQRLFSYPFGIDGQSGIRHKKLIFTATPPQIVIWERIRFLKSNLPETFFIYQPLPHLSDFSVLAEEEKRKLAAIPYERVVFVFMGASSLDARGSMEIISKISSRFPNGIIFSDNEFARTVGRVLLAAKFDGDTA